MKKIFLLLFIGFKIICNGQHSNINVDYLPINANIAFIGNSLTMFNRGSDKVVQKLGDALKVPRKLTIDQSIQVYGLTLKDHWNEENRGIIRNGKFNTVVLQEGGDWTYSTDSSNAAQFYQYAKMWADTIRKSGATPVLYMLWAWDKDKGADLVKMTNHQASQYDSISRLIKAKIIPIGRGYYKLRNDSSAIAKSINLFADYQHPSACGTYFIGCIAFSALYNISPVGNPYIGAGTQAEGRGRPTKEQALYLQKIAWETWKEYGGDDGGRGYVK